MTIRDRINAVREHVKAAQDPPRRKLVDIYVKGSDKRRAGLNCVEVLARLRLPAQPGRAGTIHATENGPSFRAHAKVTVVGKKSQFERMLAQYDSQIATEVARVEGKDLGLAG